MRLCAGGTEGKAGVTTHKHTTTTTHINTHLCQCLATEIVIAHSQCGAAILPKSGHGQSYKRLSHIDQRHAGVRHQQASGKLLGFARTLSIITARSWSTTTTASKHATLAATCHGAAGWCMSKPIGN